MSVEYRKGPVSCLQSARTRSVERIKKSHSKNNAGRRKAALSQALSENIGYPKLHEHLGAVVAYMTMSKDYFYFIEKLDRFRPRFGEQHLLPLDCGPEKDNGKGL